MKFYGNLNLNDNQAQKACLELESDFPLSPVVGRVTFKNKRVWICIESGGSPIWVPLGPQHDTYVHTQDSYSAFWEVQHDFDTTTPNPGTNLYPLVQIYDEAGKQIIPDAITYVDNSKVTVSFNVAEKGIAVCMYGDETYYSGLITPQYAYEHTQAVSASTWVVRHWLGYVPVVRVFNDLNEEIQPLAIIVDDSFQVTITFTSATSGVAKFV
jgi:hypothetical protein